MPGRIAKFPLEEITRRIFIDNMVPTHSGLDAICDGNYYWGTNLMSEGQAIIDVV